MLNSNQLNDYSNEGYVFVPELLPAAEISAVMTQLPELSTLQRPEVIFEKDSQTVRSLMNIHTYSKAADKLIRHQSIIDPVKQLLESDVYVFQCVLNLIQTNANCVPTVVWKFGLRTRNYDSPPKRFCVSRRRVR